MKNIFNIYCCIAIAIAGILFFLSFELRDQPAYKFSQIAHQAFRGENLSSIYSDSYLDTIKKYYFYQADHTNDSTFNSEVAEKIPKDSIFLISLQQIVLAGIHDSNQFPTVTSGEGDGIVCRLHVKARKNFDIVLQLKKVNQSYVLDKISNLNLFLDYYPSKRKAFEKFGIAPLTNQKLH